jgi:hypothetical protein
MTVSHARGTPHAGLNPREARYCRRAARSRHSTNDSFRCCGATKSAGGWYDRFAPSTKCAILIANLLAITVLVGVGIFLLSPRMRASREWRATVTPLASIIGSGFLVSLPVLTATVGHFAIVAMAALLMLAYLFGAAVRFNIVNGEPLFADQAKSLHLERLSHVALAFAYFVSVAYYLSLLSAFALKFIGAPDPGIARIITSALLAAIGGYGLWKGLRGLESVEEYAVGLKLAVIAAVLAALALLNIRLIADGEWVMAPAPNGIDWETIRVLLGLLIVVQGFETSRFLAGAYPPELRVLTMKRAQIWSAAIYLAFFALALVISGSHPADDDVAVVVDLVAVAAPVLPILLTAGAVFAQLSAAVADAIGSAGLLHEETAGRLDRTMAYPVIAAVGIVLVWSTDVFSIIALASRAFALFYGLQCLVAAQVAFAAPQIDHRRTRAVGFVLLAAVAFAILVFGIPVESGE